MARTTVTARKRSPFGIYLDKRKISARAAAGALGVTREHVYQLRYDGASISRKLVAKVESWTKGAVGVRDW
ncbi:MAG TPA: hypothetical protein DCQ64_11010 [Candidatus Rokubacteria bacterium]|nr:hypothetical protein [Candidatus Rokubacteria bacterium]